MVLLQSGFLPSTTLSNIFPAKLPSTKIDQKVHLKCKTSSRYTCSEEANNLNPYNISLVPKHGVDLHSSENGVERYLSLLSRGNVQRITHVLDSKKIHAQVVKLGLQSSGSIGNKLIVSYSKNLDSLDDARKLFEKIPDRTVPAYAVLIRSCGRCQLWEDVIYLAVSMVNEGLQLDKFLIPTVFKACSAMEILEFGRMVHGYVLRNKLEFDIFVGNALIDMYGNCGDLGCSRTVFDLMPERDVVSWTALVTAYIHSGNLDEAKEVFDLMQLNGVKPDVISWNALVSGTAHNGEIDEAFNLFEEMRKKEVKLAVSSWNGIISGCVQNNFFEDAFDVFNEMLESSENPNAMTFTSILPACGALGNLRLGEAIHASALKSDLFNNVYIGGSLIDMYSKCGKTEFAERVFAEMEIKDATVINEIIMARVNEGNMMEASLLVNSMMSHGLKPDLITYNTLLAGYARKGEKEEALRLLSYMIQIGLKPNLVTFNILISGFQQSGLSCEALKLFRVLNSPSGIKNTVRDGSKAYEFLFNEMPSLAIGSNSMISTSALAACADLNLLCQGKEIHGYILRSGLEPNVFTSSALVHLYAKCHDMRSAAKVFHETVYKNTVSWNTLMAGLINNMEVEEALKLFPKMMEEGLKPSSTTLRILLSACCNVASPRLGRELHGYIWKSGVDESSSTLSTALIGMYAKCGSIVDARLVFDCEVQKDIILQNAMIAGYSIYGMAKDAIYLFEQLDPSGVEPDRVTFAALLSACVHDGMLEQGWRYFNQMDRSGMKPNLEHYTCMVAIMASAGLLQEAFDFIEKMPHLPDACVWATLLKACKIHSNPGIGKRAAKALSEIEPNNASNSFLLSNTYAMNGVWESAANWKRLTKGCGMLPTKQCSSIDVGNMIHTFKDVQSSKHPKLNEIMETWDRLAGEMKHVGYLPLDPILKDEGNLSPLSCLHTEKLAICFGLISLNSNSPVRISKNLRICIDCHTTVKHISKMDSRDIFVHDGGFYHHFKDGVCSCKDRW